MLAVDIGAGDLFMVILLFVLIIMVLHGEMVVLFIV